MTRRIYAALILTALGIGATQTGLGSSIAEKSSALVRMVLGTEESVSSSDNEKNAISSEARHDYSTVQADTVDFGVSPRVEPAIEEPIGLEATVGTIEQVDTHTGYGVAPNAAEQTNSIRGLGASAAASSRNGHRFEADLFGTRIGIWGLGDNDLAMEDVVEFLGRGGPADLWIYQSREDGIESNTFTTDGMRDNSFSAENVYRFRGRAINDEFIWEYRGNLEVGGTFTKKKLNDSDVLETVRSYGISFVEEERVGGSGTEILRHFPTVESVRNN